MRYDTARQQATMITGLWKHTAVTITENNFRYKSLSQWACNIAVGCNHACRFCYVPSVSTTKLKGHLTPLGVKDPDAEWGDYVFPRQFDLEKFLRSLRLAEQTPAEKIKPDSNRAVMFCSTTDPYQVVKKDPAYATPAEITRQALELILNHSTLNVRILTRSPLAMLDFDVMQRFGKRLMFGMSLPTLDNKLASIYEPKAPAPTQRLAALHSAKAKGLNVYVAMAPTYPECDLVDMTRTMTAIKKLNPLTVFHEPINIRSENVERIQAHAREIGATVKTDVFASRGTWMHYAKMQLMEAERIGAELGLPMHLWPDASMRDHASTAWLQKWWSRVSEWPK